MAQWWTYGLADFLMFSPATYARLVERMNAALWPAQLAACAAGVLLLFLAWRGRAFPLQAVLLAVAWGTTAWWFHWERYAQIFLGATWLAAAGGVQAAALLAVATARSRDALVRHSGARWAGLALVLAALAFPLAQPLARAEVFGLMPDPTALATLGWLLTASRLRGGWRWALAAIPVLSLALGAATRWLLAQ